MQTRGKDDVYAVKTVEVFLSLFVFFFIGINTFASQMKVE